MNTKMKLVIATATGLALLGGGLAHSAKSSENGVAVNAKQAIDIALSKVPGEIREVELEQEDNIKAWDVELISAQNGKEYEMLIDATSGEVIEMELEDDDWSFFNFKAQN